LSGATHSHTRGLFGKRDDPYAGADLARARKLSAFLWLLGAACAAALLPVAPPTAAIGEGGWAIAIAVVLSAVAAAVRNLRFPTAGWNELMATSYFAVVAVGVVEWLAGGRDSPYHQLLLMSIMYTAASHPARRVLPYLGAYLAVVAAPFVYGTWTPAQAGDAVLQTIISLGLAFIALVLMASVRSQRQALTEQGAADREAAATDPLTGLGNRRALMADLERQAPDATEEAPLLLVLFDLDGFKAYNDAFGHPAGDALLTRLAQRLAGAVGDSGRPYRMGGDEFCVLANVDAAGALELVVLATEALAEQGDGFEIAASLGSVLVPSDVETPSDALRLADSRMYARKNLSRSSAGRQSADVLLSALAERDPALGENVDAVSAACVAVAAELGMEESEFPALRGAAALRDIGKLAIPDAILAKRAPLDASEWEFVKRHTVIAERILRAAPALSKVAPLVRSSHEHVDGSGYPDGLAGEQIPLASRIVTVCAAYNAMTADRPYRAALSPEQALAELRACAGTQFDPMVVDAFERVTGGVADAERVA
jgi:diguanylate cyclase (GGDEF)-like protein